MNENELKQMFAELITAQGQALGMVVQALCQQVDPAKLTADLKKVIEASRQMPRSNPVAQKMATAALAAAEAEKMLQARPLSEGPHPTRG